ncbi:choline BCCT transporter BetT [Actinomycetaceae bacterium TAE3-ERU4]|nr:choline BCCT transporter BetT [Actinomycetaceae bacterium TAE3-ERU4]
MSRHYPTAAAVKPRVNWNVFISSAVIITLIALWAIISPRGAANVLGSAVAYVTDTMGWFYVLTTVVVLLFMAWVAISTNGRRRLGPDDSKPQFGSYAWASMLFAAGIGVDLLFFSVAEPVSQYYHPPTGEGKSVEAARQAVVLTLFHYGITGWAIYALMGLAFGYFAYRFNLPLSIRSALYPLVGKRIHGALGDGVEVAAMLGTIFGVATSLGIGVVQLNYGLHLLVGIPISLSSQIALVAVAVIIATISAVSGVDKGIKRLSEINVGLAIFLVLYVFASGRARFLLNALVMNIGDYFTSLPGLSLNTYAFDNASAWMSAWTLFFWAWWVAWAPFVGLFLARISRGRTLRQYVLGTLTIPFLFVLAWVSIFGNSALSVVRSGNDKFGELAISFPERAFYDLLEQYPGATFVAALASLIGLLLYVTSADSSALVMANFTAHITDANVDGPRWSRIFWALATGILTISMLLVGGIPALQSATIVMGLPFSFVLYLLMFSLVRTFNGEPEKVATQAQLHSAIEQLAADSPTMHDPLAELNLTWAQSLSRATSYPDATTCNEFIEQTALPALRQVQKVLTERGINTVIEVDTVGGLAGGTVQVTTAQMRATLDEKRVFTYTIVPMEVALPSFALRAEPTRDIYFRAEAHLAVEGRHFDSFSLDIPSGYDLMWLTSEQVRSDISRRFEQFIEASHSGIPA